MAVFSMPMGSQLMKKGKQCQYFNLPKIVKIIWYIHEKSLWNAI